MSRLQIGTRVHIVGVGGAGMSGLARLLVEMGARVSGSDAVDTDVLDELSHAGVAVSVGHRASNVEGADVVIWSPAVALDNVELVAARAAGAWLMPRGEALADLGELRRIVGLTGTHGKTTATSMMVCVMSAANRDDAWLLGADVLGVGANGHWGRDELLLEVDESFGTFATISPHGLGVLNIEADHLDHYGNVDALEHAFARLVERTTGPVVVWHDDPGVRRLLAHCSRGVTDVGTDPASTWVVGDVHVERRHASFSLRGPSHSLSVTLGVTGAHNVANAAVVAVLALSLDVTAESVVRGLAQFQGAPRRFQFLGLWKGVDVYEDYAHLPGEIAATIAATRASGYRAITAVFQPHRVTRTVALAGAFAPAFDEASQVVVTDIYTAGEANPDGATGELVVAGLLARRAADQVTFCADVSDLPEALDSLPRPSDVLLLLGAGDVASIATRLIGEAR